MNSDDIPDRQSTRWAVRVRATQIWSTASSVRGDVISDVGEGMEEDENNCMDPSTFRCDLNSGQIPVILEEIDEDDNNAENAASSDDPDCIVPQSSGTEPDLTEQDRDSPEVHLDVENADLEPNESEDGVEAEELKYNCSLLYYLQIMYYIGMWPYDVKRKRRHWILNRIQKIFYMVCSFLSFSFVMILRVTKYRALEFLSGPGELDTFVALACYVVPAISKIYFIWLYTMHYDKLVSIIERLTEMKYAHQVLKEINKVNWTAGTTLGITAILLSLIYCLFWFYALDYWSLERLMIINTYRISEFTLLWRPQTYQNTSNTLLEELLDQGCTPSTWSLGILEAILNFFGRLQDYVMCDVLLLITLSLYQALMNFIQKVKSNTNHETGREEIWIQYDYMKSLSLQINHLFGHMIILIHMYNALNISYFVLEGFNPEDRRVGTILLGLNAAKVTVIYLVATNISYQNKKIRQWFKDLCVDGRVVEIGGRKWSISVLLDDVAENRIGIGADEFFIDQKFVLTFFTGVSTFFLMLVEFREKSQSKLT